MKKFITLICCFLMLIPNMVIASETMKVDNEVTRENMLASNAKSAILII